MLSANPYTPGPDTQDGVAAPDVSGGLTGSPFSESFSGSATAGHTWLIVVVALLLLWLLFGGLHRTIRMG